MCLARDFFFELTYDTFDLTTTCCRSWEDCDEIFWEFLTYKNIMEWLSCVCWLAIIDLSTRISNVPLYMWSLCSPVSWLNVSLCPFSHIWSSHIQPFSNGVKCGSISKLKPVDAMLLLNFLKLWWWHVSMSYMLPIITTLLHCFCCGVISLSLKLSTSRMRIFFNTNASRKGNLLSSADINSPT